MVGRTGIQSQHLTGTNITMKKSNHPAIRAYLRSKPDGATVQQITTDLNLLNANTARKALAVMPDVYIDRWIDPHRGQYQSVYCAVMTPANCPHPKDRHVQAQQKVQTVWQHVPANNN